MSAYIVAAFLGALAQSHSAIAGSDEVEAYASGAQRWAQLGDAADARMWLWLNPEGFAQDGAKHAIVLFAFRSDDDPNRLDAYVSTLTADCRDRTARVWEPIPTDARSPPMQPHVIASKQHGDEAVVLPIEAPSTRLLMAKGTPMGSASEILCDGSYPTNGVVEGNWPTTIERLVSTDPSPD